MEWISIADKLPDIKQDVLFYTESGIMLTGFRNKITTKYRNTVTIDEGFFDNRWCSAIGDVSHWRPLPGKP
jgi:hypothetical protein